MSGPQFGLFDRTPPEPPEMEDVQAEPFQRHSDTSRAAALSIAGNAGTDRRLVYDYLKAAGRYGATDLELQDALRMVGSTERPRRVRLVELGYVTDSGRRRKTPTNRDAVVWVVTGLEELVAAELDALAAGVS